MADDSAPDPTRRSTGRSNRRKQDPLIKLWETSNAATAKERTTNEEAERAKRAATAERKEANSRLADYQHTKICTALEPILNAVRSAAGDNPDDFLATLETIANRAPTHVDEVMALLLGPANHSREPEGPTRDLSREPGGPTRELI